MPLLPLAAMIARGASRCCLKLRPALPCPRLQFGRLSCRQYSMPASSAPAGSPASSAAMLAPFVNELDKIAPSFKVNGSQIQIIKSPSDFYDTLKVGILHARLGTVSDIDRPGYGMLRSASFCPHYISESPRKSLYALLDCYINRCKTDVFRDYNASRCSTSKSGAQIEHSN